MFSGLDTEMSAAEIYWVEFLVDLGITPGIE